MSERRQRFDAYYYSFGPTGVPEVDAILSAVAWAGKMYHDTDAWEDEDGGEPSEADRIQTAADACAEAMRNARGE